VPHTFTLTPGSGLPEGSLIFPVTTLSCALRYVQLSSNKNAIRHFKDGFPIIQQLFKIYVLTIERSYV
jgi:hypothetical protein